MAKTPELTTRKRQKAFGKTAQKANRREQYLAVVDNSLQLAWQKLDNPYCPANQRPALLRCIAALANVGGGLLRDLELESLAQRLAAIEERAGVANA